MISYFTTRVKLHDQWPQMGNVNSPSLDKDAWLPAGPPCADVVGARDGSWSHICFIWLCLAAKPSHVGADMDELACFLHHPMVCSWQTWVQCPLKGAALSHHAASVGGAFPGGARPSGLDIYYDVHRSGS
jgi:hypothetical protein